MKRKSIGTNYSMCVQPTFLVGTYNEDGTPNFAPITWISATFEVNLAPFAPVIYSGQYHSIGAHLGKIGDFYKE